MIRFIYIIKKVKYNIKEQYFPILEILYSSSFITRNSKAIYRYLSTTAFLFEK